MGVNIVSMRTMPETELSGFRTSAVSPRLGYPDEYARPVQSIVENPMINGT